MIELGVPRDERSKERPLESEESERPELLIERGEKFAAPRVPMLVRPVGTRWKLLRGWGEESR